MSPMIISANPGDLDRGAGGAVAGLGKGVTALAAKLSEVGKERRREQQKDREIDAEVKRAEASLLREQRIADERAQREDQRAAAKEEVMASFKEKAQGQVAAGYTSGMTEALQSSGGALGPFGMLNPRAAAVAGAKAGEIAMRMQGHMQLAERMDPATARGYLEREAGKEKERVRVESFEREAETLQDALKDGAFEPPEVLFQQAGAGGKPQEPSEQALAEAAKFSKALKTALKEGQGPGQIAARIEKRYDAARQLRMRAEDWTNADAKALELVSQVEQLAAGAGDGADPETGKSMRQTMTERLALARGEWERTRPMSFRMKTDAAESLGALQKILFQAQAQGDPEGFREEAAGAIRSERFQTPSREDVIEQAGRSQRSDAPVSLAEAPGMRPGRGAAEAAPRAPAQPVAQRSAGGAAQGGATREHVARLVRDEAGKALNAGGDRQAAMRALLERVGNDLGLDPTSPEVLQVVREELQRAMGGRARGK